MESFAIFLWARSPPSKAAYIHRTTSRQSHAAQWIHNKNKDQICKYLHALWRCVVNLTKDSWIAISWRGQYELKRFSFEPAFQDAVVLQPYLIRITQRRQTAVGAENELLILSSWQCTDLSHLRAMIYSPCLHNSNNHLTWCWCVIWKILLQGCCSQHPKMILRLYGCSVGVPKS